MGKTEGFEAYARVLLDWYRNGKRWMSVTDEDKVPIEPIAASSFKGCCGSTVAERNRGGSY
jgi:hypothetical protein